MTESMWGDWGEIKSITVPLKHLKDQATALGKDTNGRVLADVTQMPRGTDFYLELSLVAPYLHDYRFEVLSVRYPAEIYPLTVRDSATFRSYECPDEAEFLKVLGSILSSEKTRRVIATLIAQSHV